MKSWIIKILNCLAAAALVFLGGLSANSLNSQTIIAAALAGGVVLVSQFKELLLQEEQNAIIATTKFLAFF